MTQTRRNNTDRVFIVFFILITLVMIFPIYAVANHVHPLVLGLPFGLFWIVLWVVVEFLVLCGFYCYEYRGERR